MRLLRQGQKLVVASNAGEIVFVNARDLTPVTTVLTMGIYEIVDIKITQDAQWLLVAYNSGAINIHNLGDRSLDFVCQV